MLCGLIYRKWLAISFTIIGVFSLVFGVVLQNSLSPDAHSLSMLSGLFTGIGGSSAVLGIVRFIYLNIQDPQKLKLDEIQVKDERNIQILRISYSITAIFSLILFIGMAFLFLLLDYMIPAIVSIGCLYIVIIIFLISRRYYCRKM